MCKGQGWELLLNACDHRATKAAEFSGPEVIWNGPKDITSVMVWGCIIAHSMGDLHICEGTIDAEAYIGILERHMQKARQRLFPGTPCLFQQDNARPHSVQVTTTCLHRYRVCAWLACLQSRSVSYWKCMAHHEEEDQTTVTMDCWAAWVLYTIHQEWAKIPLAKLQQLISSVAKRFQSVIKRKGDVTQW